MRHIRFLVSLLLLAGLASSASGQSVTLPEKVVCKPGRMVAVKVVYDGDDVRWDVPEALDSFREYDPDPKNVRLRLSASIDTPPGTYRLTAVAAKGGKLSPFAVCLITVPGASPPPGPTPPGPNPPGPNPPGPGPGPGPTVAKNLRVLIVYDKATQLPAAQYNLVYGQAFRDFLDAKTTTDATGWHEWRIYASTENVQGETKVWQDLFARKRDSYPWMVLAGDAGVVWEGPLPNDYGTATALISKYLPPARPASKRAQPMGKQPTGKLLKTV